MYLSDLLSALDKNESIELPRSAIANIFKKQKHITISQRIALFHKLGLRGGKTQQETADSMGCPDSRPYVAQYDRVMDALWGIDDSLRSSILDALSEGALWEEGRKRKKMDISNLYNKFIQKGDRPECVHRDEDGWYIRWKSPE